MTARPAAQGHFKSQYARQCEYVKPNGERCRLAKWNYSLTMCKAHARPAAQAHTPTPWRLSLDGCETSHGLPVFLKRNGHLVASLCDHNEANANFILLACNSHDALVAALRDLTLTVVARYKCPFDVSLVSDACECNYHAAAKSARAALAAAGELSS